MSDILKALDGSIVIDIDDQYMYAKMVVTEPSNGGRAVDINDIKNALHENGITNGIMWGEIDKYMEERLFGTSVLVAQGIDAVDGENGDIYFTHTPSSELHPQIDPETGTVNFRELGKVNNIRTGELVANVKLPTEGTPGIDIRGREVKPMPGREVSYTLGAGTVLSNDRLTVVAAMDGNLRWDKDRFVVDTIVSVGGDVDVSTGNIDFVGDVIVKGSVCEGFTVKGKNVTIHQNASRSTVIADGKLEINGGAVYAKITVRGEIKLNFAENADIYCEGKVSSKSLVNCKVYATEDITVMGGKGAIVGGECICLGNITAAQVGADSYTRTVINLGNTAEMTKDYNARKEKYKADYDNYVKLQKLYNQLTAMQKSIPLTDEQEQIRRQAFRFVMTEKPRLIEVSQQLEHTEAVIHHSKGLRLMVKNRAYPGVNIRIFNSIYDNLHECGNCTFYLGENSEVCMRPGCN